MARVALVAGGPNRAATWSRSRPVNYSGWNSGKAGRRAGGGRGGGRGGGAAKDCCDGGEVDGAVQAATATSAEASIIDRTGRRTFISRPPRIPYDCLRPGKNMGGGRSRRNRPGAAVAPIIIAEWPAPRKLPGSHGNAE